MIKKVGKKMIKILIYIILLICIITIYYKFREDTFITTFYEVKNEKIHEDIRVLNLSDLHLKEFGTNNEKLVKKIKELSPDLITISGDMVNKNNDDFSVVYTLCEQLVNIAPVYYCFGNHEYSQYLFNNNNIMPELQKIGVHVLHDYYETITVKNTKIDICGCSQHKHGYDKYAKEYMNEYMKSNRFKLLLVHYPELFTKQLKNKNIDLALCGHAHGGQIRIPFIGGLYAPDQGWFPKMTQGKHQQKNGVVIINRGLGTNTKIPRIHNIPEIVVVDISSN